MASEGDETAEDEEYDDEESSESYGEGFGDEYNIPDDGMQATEFQNRPLEICLISLSGHILYLA